MNPQPEVTSAKLELLSRKLQKLYSRVLELEREFAPGLSGLALLDRLMKDPQWAWLRSLSSVVADMDHVLSQKDAPTHGDGAAVAAHVRGLLFGEGDLIDDKFLSHYRPLLQHDPELASLHGELRTLLRDLPAEPVDEAQRLHARHQWAMRCKHRLHGE
ncbi:MAG TPA: hypothetical protein VGN07_10705 [Steroidobacteraceae bacterium]|jgi:hypothetical protein